MRNPSLRLNLKGMLNKEVTINIRIYKVYLKGKLSAFDQYSNVLLDNVIEYEKDEETGKLVETNKYAGSVLLRGDSIISLTSE